jgi:hypothetical protein
MAATEEVSGHEIAGESVNPTAIFSPPSEGIDILCGGGYGAFKYAGATYGGGAKCYSASGGCAAGTDEEYAGHEFAGMCVNPAASFIVDLEKQTYGCGNGYAGGQFAALMYGGGVPCNGQTPTPLPGGVKSNVEEFCILNSSCA